MPAEDRRDEFGLGHHENDTARGGDEDNGIGREAGRFVYSMMVSLDGFIETPEHNLDWVIVDEELHRFINAQARDKVGFVCGRRLYQVLRVWDTIAEDQPALADFMVEFAEVWNAKPKVVISSTLESVGSHATLVQPDDVGAELTRLRDEADGDLDVGGAQLASAAISRGLVDEFRLFVQPVSLGAGTPFFPRDRRIALDLVGTHRFASGVTYLAYRPAAGRNNHSSENSGRKSLTR